MSSKGIRRAYCSSEFGLAGHELTALGEGECEGWGCEVRGNSPDGASGRGHGGDKG